MDLISLVTDKTTLTFSASRFARRNERALEEKMYLRLLLVALSIEANAAEERWESCSMSWRLKADVRTYSCDSRTRTLFRTLWWRRLVERKFASFFSRAKAEDALESSNRLALACKRTISRLASKVSRRIAIAPSFVARTDRVSASEGTKEFFSRSAPWMFSFSSYNASSPSPSSLLFSSPSSSSSSSSSS